MKKTITIASILIVLAVGMAFAAPAIEKGPKGTVEVILENAPELTSGTKVNYDFELTGARTDYDKEFRVKYDPSKALSFSLPAGTYELDVSYKVGRTEYDAYDVFLTVTEGKTSQITVKNFKIDY